MTAALDKPVLITGGGIGGLSLALALGQKGIEVEILEQAETFTELGAGIQLGPNATRILHRWGLETELEKYAVRPDHLQIRNGRNNRTLNTISLTPESELLFGSPYYTIHRSDLQQILLNTIQHLKNITVTNAFQVSVIENTKPDIVRAMSTTGQERVGSILIGADGIWSSVRTHIHPHLQPKYSGKTAWRALISMNELPDQYKNSISLYLGPDSHLVHYPVKRGKNLNIIAVITDHEKPERKWDKTADSQQLIDAFHDWSPDIRNFLSAVAHWTKWSLYEHPCPRNWTSENMALLGDAVHPTLPFMAQGAVMAIEDADCLAQCIASGEGDIKQRLIKYQNERYPRTSKVQKLSKKQGKIYHFTGPLAYARNLVIANRSSGALLQEYDWLYSYDKKCLS